MYSSSHVNFFVSQSSCDAQAQQNGMQRVLAEAQATAAAAQEALRDKRAHCSAATAAAAKWEALYLTELAEKRAASVTAVDRASATCDAGLYFAGRLLCTPWNQ